jgi:hypothetical protein
LAAVVLLVIEETGSQVFLVGIKMLIYKILSFFQQFFGSSDGGSGG